MKRLLGFALFALITPVSRAEVPYLAHQQDNERQNDPFVFCTEGVKNRPRAWSPVNHKVGLWIFNLPYCPTPTTSSCPVYPYTYQPWSQDDFTALGKWLAICTGTKGGKSDWQGQGRASDSVIQGH